MTDAEKDKLFFLRSNTKVRWSASITYFCSTCDAGQTVDTVPQETYGTGAYAIAPPLEWGMWESKFVCARCIERVRTALKKPLLDPPGPRE